MSADRVVVLEDAQVAQIGRPDELIVRDGPFATLFGAPMVLLPRQE
jgi:ABC-type multidrug transport system fused ATPase/permease subunit